MKIENLDLPLDWSLPVGQDFKEKLFLCCDRINAEENWDMKLKYLSSWILVINQLRRLGKTTGVTISFDFAELSFGWSAAGMCGGWIFDDCDGWQLHS